MPENSGDAQREASTTDNCGTTGGSATPSTTAANSKVALLESSHFSLSDSIGGVRGVLESVLPTLIFMVTFIISRQIMLSSILAGICCAAFVFARLLQRQNVMQAIVGLLLVAISGWAAYSSHDARNFYTPGFLINASWSLAMVISLLARTPAVGVVVELVHTPLSSAPGQWRLSWVSKRKLYGAYLASTWLWLALFGLRLAVELPLWLTHHVDALGIARLVLGIPAFALVFWLTWVWVSPVLRSDNKPEESAQQQAQHEEIQL